MADLFVSYKAEDRARVARLVRALEASGFSVWWDAHISGGEQWRDAISHELETARQVIVVWSRHSVGPHGQFVRDEATRAMRRDAYLPIRIDPVEPPLGFGESQAFDLQKWPRGISDPRFKSLLQAINHRIGHAPSTTTLSTSTPPALSRRTVIIGGTATAAAALAGGGWWMLRPRDKQSSIAVMPFANLSGDPAQTYFSDGIAEEVRAALSRIPGIEVMARMSSEALRDDDTKAVASKLGVANILSGSVRRSPDMIRIAAQLVDRTGVEQWSASYDRAPGDALQIQTDIANKVADALSIQLGSADRERLMEGGTRNPKAHDLLLEARANTRYGDGVEYVERAIGMVDAALALDPRYAEAWATKADLEATRAGTYANSAAQVRQRYAEATFSARKAIELAPRSRVGHLALATILDQQLKRREAWTQYERALSLSGEDADTLAAVAVFYSEMRKPSEAADFAIRSQRRDPLNPRSYWVQSYVFENLRRYDQALAAARRLHELVPQRRNPIATMATMQLLSGDLAGAAENFKKVEPLTILNCAPRAVLAIRQSDPQLATALLERIRKEGGEAAYYQQAQVLAQLGRTAEAVQALEKARALGDPGLTQTLVDPFLDPLRKDARFLAFEKSLDFPAASA